LALTLSAEQGDFVDKMVRDCIKLDASKSLDRHDIHRETGIVPTVREPMT
jgi:hypothetical protein